jgi:hypothetical protein
MSRPLARREGRALVLLTCSDPVLVYATASSFGSPMIIARAVSSFNAAASVDGCCQSAHAQHRGQ